MKIVAWCLSALVVLVSLTTACKKDPKPSDPVVVHDTLIVKDTVIVNPPPPVCTPNLTKGLLAYYPFNGNFNDESGNGNNGTAFNGAFITSDFAGKLNSCAGFDGINDYVKVPGSSKLNSDTVTVSFQVMANTVNRFYAMVSRQNFETANSTCFSIHHMSATDSTITFSTPRPDDCSVIYNNPEPTFWGYSMGPIRPTKWYNIICSYAGGVQRIYVNGVLESALTKAWKNARKCDNGDLMIGGWWKNDLGSINGKIDEVRLYNRVLTECEIAKLAEGFTGN
ncbi:MULTISPECIES: LamG domain-containing protein [Niastella]|uniref:LamG domain-containing protein n=1 Tax=Niastella soli TaxID=2821487 RepID=A0ABS3Z3G9_9BACT|nr:LamG domain-containing protein [Niastella soli]MBO9204583.1 LamG domain-containing protein [Niastella soli]